MKVVIAGDLSRAFDIFLGVEYANVAHIICGRNQGYIIRQGAYSSSISKSI